MPTAICLIEPKIASINNTRWPSDCRREHLDNTYALDWSNHNPRSVYRQNYFYRITECLYGFPHPLPVPRNQPTMPCRHQKTLAHPLNVIRGSIAAYK